MRTADFDFPLPPELIAQAPAPQRDASRLLLLDRRTGVICHLSFGDILGYLRPGDVLVLNNSKVIPARIRGVNVETGGQFEALLLEENALNDWWALMRPAKRARPGTRILLTQSNGSPSQVIAMVVEGNAEGHRRLRFESRINILDVLDALGEMPLPPYIQRAGNHDSREDQERYQTVFAQLPGSIAAPTAGLHFTPRLLQAIEKAGVKVQFLTLHVGLGTFAPVKAETLEDHLMHAERFEVCSETADAINHARAAGNRVVAVGTTSVRVLEHLGSQGQGRVCAGKGSTRIFIHPPFRFQVVDAMLTNFHLPRSTLLMLVSAFAAPGKLGGRERVLTAYAEAVRERYRFYSYGDAMLIC
jgi:S-adenosylmethionine:tRNA ribosyltransferase-isomerase